MFDLLFSQNSLIRNSEDTETVIHSDDAFAQVAYLRFKKCSTVEKTEAEMDMSNVVIQSWRSWDSYDTIVSAVENTQKVIVARPSTNVIDDKTTIASVSGQREVESDNFPFLAIGGTTAYDRDASLTFDSIEDETKACMNILAGTWKIFTS